MNVMAWFAVESELMKPDLAMPLALSATGEPKSVPSILNWTRPPGIVEPGETARTVAVNCTDCPCNDGFRLLVAVLDVSAGLTVWVSVELTLELRAVSPE